MNMKLIFLGFVFCWVFLVSLQSKVVGNKKDKMIFTYNTICDVEKKRADSLQQLVLVYRLKELRTQAYLKIANNNKRESKYLLGWLNRVWSK